MGDVPAGNFIGTILWTARIAANKSVALATCEALGMPVAAHKVQGPTKQLVFLRLELDTMAQVLRLPKLDRTEAELDPCRPASACIDSGAGGTFFSAPPNRLDGRSPLPGVTHRTRGVGSRQFAVVAIGVSWLERDRGRFALGCGTS